MADADPVGLWQDQSGKGNHVSQGTGSKKPTLKVAQKNGYSSIRTDGVNDYLKSSAFTLNQPVFGILALKLIAAADGSRYWDGNAADSAECYQAASGGLGGVRIYAGSAAIGPVSFTSGTFRLIETLHNAASSQIWVNTVSGVTGSIGTNNPGGITLGARGDGVSGFSNLDILEFCLFSTTPSAANQALLEYYFNSRYSLY